MEKLQQEQHEAALKQNEEFKLQLLAAQRENEALKLEREALKIDHQVRKREIEASKRDNDQVSALATVSL